jgi:hypothetical protein
MRRNATRNSPRATGRRAQRQRPRDAVRVARPPERDATTRGEARSRAGRNAQAHDGPGRPEVVQGDAQHLNPKEGHRVRLLAHRPPEAIIPRAEAAGNVVTAGATAAEGGALGDLAALIDMVEAGGYDASSHTRNRRLSTPIGKNAHAGDESRFSARCRATL